MLCQNCRENEANVRYTQIINGVKKEMALCEKCADELGIGKMDFNMPINFSSFLGDFFDEEKEFLPSFMEPEKLICDKCGMSYEDFINTGKFGCENCYEIFSNKLDPILKNIHGGNRHIGRGISLPKGKSEKLKVNREEQSNNVAASIAHQQKENNVETDAVKYTQNSQLDELKKNLKQAIQEERYEDAAKLRDEIKKLEN